MSITLNNRIFVFISILIVSIEISIFATCNNKIFPRKNVFIHIYLENKKSNLNNILITFCFNTQAFRFEKFFNFYLQKLIMFEYDK